MSALSGLLRRELKLAWRQGAGIGSALGFFLCVIVLLPLGVGPDQALLQRIAPGVLWIAVLLSVLLSAERIFTADYEDGSLEVMMLAPVALELMTLVKALAHWLTTSLPLAVLAPALGFLLNLHTDLIAPLAAAMLIGSLALSLLAMLGAAVTVGLRRGGLLISLLVLPLYVPVLIFGIAASAAGRAGPDISTSAFLILTAIVLVTVVLAPLAAAAALRAHAQ